jgi:hypothetical protein
VFWAAGTIRWVWGWALVGLYAGWIISAAVLLILTNPELRGARARKGIRVDVTLMSIVAMMVLAQEIVGGDYRLGGPGPCQCGCPS